MKQQAHTLAEIAKLLGAELHGDPTVVVTGINTLDAAQAGQITFLDNPRYRKHLAHTQAAAVILASADLAECPTNALVLAKPYVGYAKVAAKYATHTTPASGVHPTAIIGEHCQIHPSASIGPNCVLDADVIIEANVVIEAGCAIGKGTHIGAQSYLYPHVTLYHATIIGQRAIIHSGVVIGSDGFGFANDNGVWLKIPQLGNVEIGNDVEIGANTTVDRGALGNTVIEDGVKLDNQIQIGHNVHIGAHTIIAGCTGIAGSTRIGKYCLIGGGVGIIGHLEITDKVIITGMSGVSHSITEPGVYSSGFVAQPNRIWWKNVARFRELDAMADKLQKLEKLVNSHIIKHERD